MTLVLKSNIQIKENTYPFNKAIIMPSLMLYTSFNENKNEGIFNVFYSEICILLNNNPIRLPIWAINSLTQHINKYSKEEIDFIYFKLSRFNDSVSKLTNSTIDKEVEKTLEHYCHYRKFISWDNYAMTFPLKTKILRFYSNINDFNTVYKRYGSYDLSTQFEFDLSKQELDNSEQGSWILRKSSLSRLLFMPESQREETLKIIKKYLIEFYAITWKKFSGTYHMRFIFVPWKGWCVLKSPVSFDLNITPPSFEGKWFVCFVDCLEYLLTKYNLRFQNLSNKH